MNKFLIGIAIFTIVSCKTSKGISSDIAEEMLITSTSDDPLDRTIVPSPGPAPEIKIGEYQYFQLDNGLKVYVVENRKLPRVAFSLQVDRDPILEGDKAGYTSMVANLLGRGTKERTKSDIDEAIDYIGATFNTTSTGMFGSSLTKHKDGLLSIMQDVLLNPTFPQDELDKLKKLELSNLVSNKEDPGTIATNIRAVAVYGKDHPYGEMISEMTINNITRDDCVNYFNKYWSPQNAYLAIVGDINIKEAKLLANQYFASWKTKVVPKQTFEKVDAPEVTRVILVDRPQSVQSEIRVAYPVKLNIGDKDFFSVTLLNQILGGGFSSRLMQNLREDKAYTYGAGSGFTTDKVIGRFSASTSVRNEVTDSAIHEIMVELEKIAKEGVTLAELNAAKAYLTGSFARSLESPQTIAGFAINTAINQLPQSFYPEYLKNLEAVTVQQVNASALKYILPTHANIVVVGKASEIANKLSKFGPISYYDTEGKTYDPSAMNASLEGMKPQTIIDKYLNEIGGKDKLNSISNQSLTWNLEYNGMALNVSDVRSADGKFRQEIIVQGMVVQQIVSDGKDITTIAQGKKQTMEESSKSTDLISNRLFPELYYEKSGIKLSLKGNERINGSDAYQIVIFFPSGEEISVFFDSKTGLKVKEVASVGSPMGEMTKTVTYSDYKEVNGVKYAHTETTQAGPQSFKATLSKVETNTIIETDYFKVN